jgi:hypothetical protein
MTSIILEKTLTRLKVLEALYEHLPDQWQIKDWDKTAMFLLNGQIVPALKASDIPDRLAIPSMVLERITQILESVPDEFVIRSWKSQSARDFFREIRNRLWEVM